jgi:hypothetical protein
MVFFNLLRQSENLGDDFLIMSRAGSLLHRVRQIPVTQLSTNVQQQPENIFWPTNIYGCTRIAVGLPDEIGLLTSLRSFAVRGNPDVVPYQLANYNVSELSA